MVEYLDKREKDAFRVGFRDFWDNTLRDLVLYEEAYNKRKKEELQIKIQLDYDNNMVMGRVIGVLLSGKGKVPELADLYPELFDKEREAPTAENDVELKRKVAGFKAFAQLYNLQHKDKHGG